MERGLNSCDERVTLKRDELGRYCVSLSEGRSFAGYDDKDFDSDSYSYLDLIYPPDRPLRMARIKKLLETLKCVDGASLNFQIGYRILASDRSIKNVHERGTLFKAKDGKKFELYSTIHMVQERRKDLKRANINRSDFQGRNNRKNNYISKANSNVLTNKIYKNRANFRSKIELERKETTLNDVWFICIGIDQLPLMNSAFGLRTTDDILKAYGQRISEFCVHKGLVHDASSRIGGDRFGIYLNDGEKSVKDVQDFIKGVLKYLHHTPYEVKGKAIQIGFSAGYVDLKGLYDSCDLGIEDFYVIERAETALKLAQKYGRGTIIAYDDELTPFHGDYSKTVLDIGEMFLSALQDQRLKMAYQPIVDTSSQKVLFYETLLRLVDRNGEIVRADYLTPALHELGMIRLVDCFALTQALEELTNHPNLNLSVNAARTTITDPAWQKILLSKIEQFPSIAERLIVEIVENGHSESIRKMSQSIEKIRKIGVRIAIDDFGAGHTSFSELMNLDVDIIKIDKQFINHPDPEKGRAFIRAVHRLARDMGALTIGEGVENEAQLELFHQDGIRNVQGYYYGRPTLQRAKA